MKKITKRLICAVILCAALCSPQFKVNAQVGDISVDVPDPKGDFDKCNRCRCKSGSCFGGNAISFRSCCYKGNEAVHCHEYDSNC